MHAQTKACSDVCLVHGLATAGEAGTGFSALAPSDTPPPLAPCCGPSPRWEAGALYADARKPRNPELRCIPPTCSLCVVRPLPHRRSSQR